MLNHDRRRFHIRKIVISFFVIPQAKSFAFYIHCFCLLSSRFRFRFRFVLWFEQTVKSRYSRRSSWDEHRQHNFFLSVFIQRSNACRVHPSKSLLFSMQFEFEQFFNLTNENNNNNRIAQWALCKSVTLLNAYSTFIFGSEYFSPFAIRFSQYIIFAIFVFILSGICRYCCMPQSIPDSLFGILDFLRISN